jgi:hypothetical protein
LTQNFNTTGDIAIALTGPASGRWAVSACILTNPSATPTSAKIGFYTAASAGGTNLFGGAATITTLTTGGISEIWNTYQLGTSASTTIAYTSSSQTLYCHLSIANGSALTVDIYIEGIIL